MHLINGRAEKAAEYPEMLSRGFLQTLMAEMETEKGGNLCSIDELHEPEPEWDLAEDEEHVDSVTGHKLDPELARAAVQKEMRKMMSLKVYDTISRTEAKTMKNGKWIDTRWVKTLKNINEVRARLVGREFAHGDPRDDLFAGVPPLHLVKLLVSLCASTPGNQGLKVKTLTYVLGKVG